MSDHVHDHITQIVIDARFPEQGCTVLKYDAIPDSMITYDEMVTLKRCLGIIVHKGGSAEHTTTLDHAIRWANQYRGLCHIQRGLMIQTGKTDESLADEVREFILKENPEADV